MDRQTDIYDIPTIPIKKMNNKIVEKAIDEGLVMLPYGHGIEGVSGFNPINRERFANHVKSLMYYKKDIWFTTFKQLILYLRKTGQIG